MFFDLLSLWLFVYDYLMLLYVSLVSPVLSPVILVSTFMYFLFYFDSLVTCVQFFEFCFLSVSSCLISLSLLPSCLPFPHYPVCIYSVCFLLFLVGPSVCHPSRCLCVSSVSFPCVSWFLIPGFWNVS